MNYQITDLERITGIKAHTIRIWEKRYALLKPNRTHSNIRYYDDTQALKLLNISSLLGNGFKISHVALLTEEELIAKTKQILTQHVKENTNAVSLLNSLIGATLEYNEKEFSTLFDNTFKVHGVYNGMVNVIYPFLNRLGLMWQTNESFPAQEHFASSLIRRKLLTQIDSLPLPNNNSKRVILFLPPNEWHDIGLIFSDYLLRFKGYQTIYLGQNVPINNVELVVHQTKPTHLITFFIAKHSSEQLNEVILNPKLVAEGRVILIGGLQVSLKESNKNIRLLNKPSDLEEYF